VSDFIEGLQNASFTERLLRGMAHNNEDAYWVAFSSYNKTAQFDQAVSILTTLQEKFSFIFTTEEFQKNPE